MKQLFNKFFSLPGYYISSLAIAGLLVLMIYSGFKGDQIYQNLQRRLLEPVIGKYQAICLSFIKIEDIDGVNANAIDRRKNIFNLQIDESWGVRKGGTYSFTGIITPSGKIKVTEIQPHRHRKLKYIFSSLSFIVVIFLIIRYFRFDKNGIYLIRIIDDGSKAKDNNNP